MLSLLFFGCLPPDPPDFRRDAGAGTQPARPKVAKSPKREGVPRVLSSGAPARVRPPAAGALISEPFSDDFNRETLGPDWYATSDVWRLEDGRLCGRGAKNHPVWLLRRLPRNARIEFDATSASPDGDLKVEVWGDGRSAASGTSYEDATGYILILGGWKNSLHVLARRDEHGANRLEVRTVPGSNDLRTQPVVEGKSYHFEIVRDDGRTVRFSVDDSEIHAFEDPEPLYGKGHEHLGFNDWAVPVCFDDLLITPLEE